jgi:hypothetical protein
MSLPSVRQLAKDVWAEALGVERVGIHHNILDRGTTVTRISIN